MGWSVWQWNAQFSQISWMSKIRIAVVRHGAFLGIWYRTKYVIGYQSCFIGCYWECFMVAAGWHIRQGVCWWSSRLVWTCNNYCAEELHSPLLCICRLRRGLAVSHSHGHLLSLYYISETVNFYRFDFQERGNLLGIMYDRINCQLLCYGEFFTLQSRLKLEKVHTIYKRLVEIQDIDPTLVSWKL